MLNSEQIVEKYFPTFEKHFLLTRTRWINLPAHLKTILKLLPIFIILAAIPLTVNLSQQTQNIEQHAQTVPTPTPAQVRPFAAPVTVNTVNIPSTIDATGVTDVSAALNAFIKSVPNGSVINFPSSATYLLSTYIHADGQNIVLQGNGATLKSAGGYQSANSLIETGGSNIGVYNFNLVGASPTPGVYIPGQEYAYGVLVYGANNVEIANTTISNVYGDGVNVDDWSDGVWLHNSTINRPGRSGFVVLAGKNMLIENNLFYNTSNTSGIFDIEPYQTSGGSQNFTFRNNTISGNNFYFAANGGSIESNITIDHNTVTNGTLDGIIWLASPRPQQIAITNNIARGLSVPWNPEVNGDGGIYLEHIDGLTFYGNVEQTPFSPTHDLGQIVDSTGIVTTSPSSPTPTLTPAPVSPTVTATPKPTPEPSPTATLVSPTPTTVAFSITSGPTVGSVTSTGATITWYLSDYGTGQVEYGTTSSYGLLSTPETSFNWNYHIQSLSNLTPGTVYHYRVKSTNQAGVTVVSKDYTFTTSGSNAIPTQSPTSTITLAPTFTPTPTPVQKKNCLKFWHWQFCF